MDDLERQKRFIRDDRLAITWQDAEELQAAIREVCAAAPSSDHSGTIARTLVALSTKLPRIFHTSTPESERAALKQANERIDAITDYIKLVMHQEEASRKRGTAAGSLADRFATPARPSRDGVSASLEDFSARKAEIIPLRDTYIRISIHREKLNDNGEEDQRVRPSLILRQATGTLISSTVVTADDYNIADVGFEAFEDMLTAASVVELGETYEVSWLHPCSGVSYIVDDQIDFHTALRVQLPSLDGELAGGTGYNFQFRAQLQEDED